MSTFNPQDRETGRWVACHFCSEFRLYVTVLDKKASVAEYYGKHLEGHAASADIAAVENATFDALMKQMGEGQ